MEYIDRTVTSFGSLIHVGYVLPNGNLWELEFAIQTYAADRSTQGSWVAFNYDITEHPTWVTGLNAGKAVTDGHILDDLESAVDEAYKP